MAKLTNEGGCRPDSLATGPMVVFYAESCRLP
jgi:hypothetical protein